MKKGFQYSSNIQSISQIRDDLDALALKWDIPSSELRQITIMVEELFSNIVRFSFEDDAEHQINITLSNSGTRIKIIMDDDGIQFNPLEYNPDQLTDPTSTEDGGMGLSLIRAFAETIEYKREDGKNQLIIVKTFRSRP